MNHTNYRCARCGTSGCKLWRESYVMLNQVELLCANCTAKEENKEISTMGPDGKWMSEWGPTDQIGSWLPAVPTEDGKTFWGYTSVPDAGCQWWRDLPSLPG